MDPRLRGDDEEAGGRLRFGERTLRMELKTMSQQNFTNNRIAFVQAGWHKDITDEAKKTFVQDMVSAGFQEKNIDYFDVPGSLEIPLQAKLLAKTGRYDVIVCAGFIINGGIYHHEYVNHAVIDGLMRVSLDTEIPVLSVVLTPLIYHEIEPHHQFFLEHFKLKGQEAAQACIQTLGNMRSLKALAKAA